jgi:acetyl esterase
MVISGGLLSWVYKDKRGTLMTSNNTENSGREVAAFWSYIVLDDLTRTFVAELESSKRTPLFMLSYEDARTSAMAVQENLIAKAPVTIEGVRFPIGPTGSVNVQIVRPAGTNTRLPIILYLHGGGWIFGNRQTHDRLIRELSVGAGAALFFVDYLPAPEAQYPLQNEQAYAALVHIVQNAASLNVDGARVAVVGDGAGGNMAAVVALMTKFRQGPSITFQALLCPVTDFISENDSYKRFSDGPILTVGDMAYFFDAYLPHASSRHEITAFPLRATVDELRGLPAALIIVSEYGLLRDEGEAYGTRLSDAGVLVTSVRYNGTVHGFMVINALADTQAAKAAVAQTIGALKTALG